MIRIGSWSVQFENWWSIPQFSVPIAALFVSRSIRRAGVEAVLLGFGLCIERNPDNGLCGEDAL